MGSTWVHLYAIYNLHWTIKLYFASIIHRSPILLCFQLPLHTITLWSRILTHEFQSNVWDFAIQLSLGKKKTFALCNETIGFTDSGNGNVSLGYLAHYFEKLLYHTWSPFPNVLLRILTTPPL